MMIDYDRDDIWLFPGINGSGRFHQPFCEALAPHFSCSAFPLPAQGRQDYEFLCAHFSAQFEQRKRPVTIIGESFSGPLVYELALRFPDKINRVIWAASFVANPRPRLTKIPLPAAALEIGHYLPSRPLYRLGFRGQGDMFWSVFLEERASFDARVWHARINAVKQRATPHTQLPQPALYLQATDDLLIRPYALQAVTAIAPQLTVKRIKATHLLLQTNYQEAARTVIEWMQP